MTFDNFESSRSRGAPNTLYKFTYQNRVFAYTDAEESITFAGTEYVPVAIDRGAVSTSGTLDKATLTINASIDLPVVELFRVYPPSDVVGITVFQGHAEYEIDFLAVWTGRVISCSRAGSTATLLAEPVNTSMKRPGLRRRFQYGCPHVLYGPQCRANRASFTVTATVVSISRANIVLAGGWNSAFDKANFVDGILEWTGVAASTELRSILNVDGGADMITVTGQTAGLAPGQAVNVSLGCNHQMSGCNIFSNIQNFGGQPWIPTKNPIGFVNQYY